MANAEIAKALIQQYQKDRLQYLETVRQINDGLRHFDQKPAFNTFVETTEDYRRSALDSIARLEKLIALYEKDLKDAF